MVLMKKYIISGAIILIGLMIFLAISLNVHEKELLSLSSTKDNNLVQNSVDKGILTKKGIVEETEKEIFLDSAIENNPKAQQDKLEKKKNQEIEEKFMKEYKPRFAKISNLADEKLTNLIQQAHKEFKITNERKQDLADLEIKYKDIQKKYEETTKSQFDIMFDNMREDAIEQGIFNQDLGKEFQLYYKIQKEKRLEKLNEEVKKLS
jgi:hypothetical protein